MLHFRIFTDGSVNTQTKIGYGACLVVSDLSTPPDSLKDSVKVKRFEHTSSTKLELQTLLWALDETIGLINGRDVALTIYTDSQNIIGLPGRRARLERSNYTTGKNKPLNNTELYKAFYKLSSGLSYELVKVIGHQASSKKSPTDKLFGLVDRVSRSATREKSKDPY